MQDDLKVTKIRGDLNIVLSEEQINSVVRSVLGPHGENFGSLVALASDHCCVDASVGSSVAGPISSVASSVNVPTPDMKVVAVTRASIPSKKLAQKISEKNIATNITMPGTATIR